MALRFIRQPSDTPNIANSDDARMIRYAYGGQDGYVKNKGSEIGYQIDGSTFRVTSGVVSLQGYESEVDAGGVEISTAGASSMRYFNVFYEVNLATQTTSIKSAYSTGTYPSFDAGDDLTQNSTGTARLLLYTFTVTNNVIASVQKKVQAIPYAEINEINRKINDVTDTVNTLKETQLYYNDSGVGMGSAKDDLLPLTSLGNVLGKRLKVEIGQKTGGSKSSSQFFELAFYKVNDTVSVYYISDFSSGRIVTGRIQLAVRRDNILYGKSVIRRVGVYEGDPTFNPGPHFTSTSEAWEKYLFGVWQIGE